MQTIKEILTFPNGTPIEAVQAKIGKVFEYRQVPTEYGPKTAQNFYLEDAAGNKIKASIWEHPDLSTHEGQEYVFLGGKGGKGIKVKHGSYVPKGEKDPVKTVELSLGKTAQLQYIEVYRGQNPGDKPAPEPAKAPNGDSKGQDTRQHSESPYKAVNGAKVGMALNNAVLMLTSTGDVVAMDKVKETAIEIIRLSNDLESGKIAIDAPAEKAQPAPTTPAKQEATDEDAPY